MMTPAQKNIATAPKSTEENGSQIGSDGGGLKTPSAAASRPRQAHQPAGIKCPRCNSPNTKFCYYNNYSPAQPRHFCKTCHRYWTKGGALRNIPIGGGSRQNKKTATSFSSSKDNAAGNGNGLRFFQGLSPTVDFQLDYYGAHMTPEANPTAGFLNQIASTFRDISANSSRLVSTANPNSFGTILNPDSGNQSPPPSLGFNFPLYYKKEGGVGCNTLGFQDLGPSLLSSMEPLSHINQDLNHWKSQQQRLGLLFVGDYSNDNNDKESTLVPFSSAGVETPVQRPQPILYQNMEISSADESCTVTGALLSKNDDGDLSTEWPFGINNNNNNNNNNSYAAVHEDQTRQTTSDNNLNNEKSSRIWSGLQAWTGLGHF